MQSLIIISIIVIIGIISLLFLIFLFVFGRIRMGLIGLKEETLNNLNSIKQELESKKDNTFKYVEDSRREFMNELRAIRGAIEYIKHTK